MLTRLEGDNSASRAGLGSFNVNLAQQFLILSELVSEHHLKDSFVAPLCHGHWRLLGMIGTRYIRATGDKLLDTICTTRLDSEHECRLAVLVANVDAPR